MSSSEMTIDEMSMSLTGYDELAIEKAFGADFMSMAGQPTKAGRALVFVDLRRRGRNDKQAKDGAMELPLQAVMDYFAADLELDPENPVTPSGEGAEPLA